MLVQEWVSRFDVQRLARRRDRLLPTVHPRQDVAQAVTIAGEPERVAWQILDGPLGHAQNAGEIATLGSRYDVRFVRIVHRRGEFALPVPLGTLAFARGG